MTDTNREWMLAARPSGDPDLDCFELRETVAERSAAFGTEVGQTSDGRLTIPLGEGSDFSQN